MSRSEKVGAEVQALPVLVVDDESDNLDAFRFNFRKGFRILTAQSAQAGLEILAKEPVPARRIPKGEAR